MRKGHMTLTNHLYHWDEVRYHIQADNGKQLIVIRSDEYVGKPMVYEKASFIKNITPGKAEQQKVGQYNFDRYTFQEWMDKHKLYWRYNS
jgi:hypothetical protein